MMQWIKLLRPCEEWMSGLPMGIAFPLRKNQDDPIEISIEDPTNHYLHFSQRFRRFSDNERHLLGITSSGRWYDDSDQEYLMTWRIDSDAYEIIDLSEYRIAIVERPKSHPVQDLSDELQLIVTHRIPIPVRPVNLISETEYVWTRPVSWGTGLTDQLFIRQALEFVTVFHKTAPTSRLRFIADH